MAVVFINAKPNQYIYGFNDGTNAHEVARLVTDLRHAYSPDAFKKIQIFILTGTHGNPEGDLLAEKRFLFEDRLLELRNVIAVNVNQNTPPNTWRSYFTKRNSIIVLAWCYSAYWKDLPLYTR